MLGLLTTNLICALNLPEGGRYLPTLEADSQLDARGNGSFLSLQTLILVNQSSLSSAVNPAFGPAPSFYQTRLEKKLGVLRPRLAQSQVDIDLVNELRSMNSEER